jgi:hypothetical protein
MPAFSQQADIRPVAGVVGCVGGEDSLDMHRPGVEEPNHRIAALLG